MFAREGYESGRRKRKSNRQKCRSYYVNKKYWYTVSEREGVFEEDEEGEKRRGRAD